MEFVEMDRLTFSKWERYRRAQEAKSKWTAEEKDAKASLLAELGYDPDDPKPTPCQVLDEDDLPVFEVKVGSRTQLDIGYLRKQHPNIYAECERTGHPISIRALGD